MLLVVVFNQWLVVFVDGFTILNILLRKKQTSWISEIHFFETDFGFGPINFHHHGKHLFRLGVFSRLELNPILATTCEH